MTDGGDVQAAIERAVRDRAEQARLRQRRDGAAGYAQQTQQRVAELRAKLADETEDVAALESFSLTRIWAGLKGSRDADLSRETAERDAARYAVAEAEARHDAAVRDLGSLDAQLAALGDVDAAYARALEAREELLRGQGGDPTGRRLVEIAERRGELVAQDKETAEAHRAGRQAHDLLAEAHRQLGGARSWAAWDTFGGGGMLTDMMKYDKLDRVTALVRQADIALGGFSRELADVGIEAVDGVRIDGLTRTFDVWFDNFFSDMAVRSRIAEAEQRVAATLTGVAQILDRLADQGRGIAAEIGALDAERERLLLAT